MVKTNLQKEEEEKMKKLITILTIMIVLIGAAFATDDAKINLTVTLAEKVPTFKLATFNNANVLVSEVSDAVEADGSSTAAAATFETAVGETLADGGVATVNFAIVQVKPNNINKIKTTHTYSFKVTATALKHATKSDNFAVKEISTITAIDNAIAAEYATITDGNPLSIQYTGKTYNAAAEVSFAKFSVSWQGDAAAVPGAYTGSVTLTMTTT